MRVCELQEGSCSDPRFLIYIQANRARLGTVMLLEKKKKRWEGCGIGGAAQQTERGKGERFLILFPNSKHDPKFL